MNAASILFSFSLGLVQVSSIQVCYDCDDDKEHVNRISQQLTVFALNARAQFSNALGKSRVFYVPKVPCLRFWRRFGLHIFKFGESSFVSNELLLSGRILDISKMVNRVASKARDCSKLTSERLDVAETGVIFIISAFNCAKVMTTLAASAKP